MSDRRQRDEAYYLAANESAAEVERLRGLVEQHERAEKEGTDGPVYNAGRSEGHADVCAELRTIIDPQDKNHWNKDGLLAEVERLRARVSELEARRPVVCAVCDGEGMVHKIDGEGMVPAAWSAVAHTGTTASIEPCERCVVCPDCGHDGCGPGVRWE